MTEEKDKKTEGSLLFIDDDVFLRDMYATKFKNAGFSVEVTEGGEKALDLLRNGYEPDLILLDLVMPNMDGLQFVEALKKESLASGSKIVMLTNQGQSDDIKKAKKLGVTDYIIKASSVPSEVVNEVKKILKK